MDADTRSRGVAVLVCPRHTELHVILGNRVDLLHPEIKDADASVVERLPQRIAAESPILEVSVRSAFEVKANVDSVEVSQPVDLEVGQRVATVDRFLGGAGDDDGLCPIDLPVIVGVVPCGVLDMNTLGVVADALHVELERVGSLVQLYCESLVVVDLRGLVGVIPDDAEPELVGVDVIDVFRGRVDVVVRAGAIEDHAVENADGMSELRFDGYGLDRSTRLYRAEVEAFIRGRTALENGEVVVSIAIDGEFEEGISGGVGALVIDDCVVPYLFLKESCKIGVRRELDARGGVRAADAADITNDMIRCDGVRREVHLERVTNANSRAVIVEDELVTDIGRPGGGNAFLVLDGRGEGDQIRRQ